MADTPKRSEADLKGFSCLSCRQRKVKCDRRAPCINCVKAERQCSFVAPVRGKRKRTKPPKETLHARVRRYEEMLKAYGAKIEPCEDEDESESETGSGSGTSEMGQVVPMKLPTCRASEEKPKFIMKEGASRYFDRYGFYSVKSMQLKMGFSYDISSAIWSNLSEDFQHPESTNFNDVGEAIPVETDSHLDDSRLFFEPESVKIESLAKLHLSTPLLSRLRDIYKDRVDPMMKILHLPTFWTTMTNALQRPLEMPKSLQALVFAFYLVSISSLKEEEAQNLFGLPLSVITKRYRIAARQALVNARFLSTSNLMTLQAFSIFTVHRIASLFSKLLVVTNSNQLCVRKVYRCDTLYILSGVAIRLARKMGLHRDGTFLGLPPFETEMRRRLWWHLAHVDCRTADVMGTKPSPEISSGDVKLPINVDDDELHPDMTSFPKERNGTTAISLCLLKGEIMETLCRFAKEYTTDLRWEMLYNPEISLAGKDRIIEGVEDHLERKYLRYCDPSNPLDTFISIMARSAVCKMRLFAHNIRQFAHLSAKASQKDHDVSFFNAMKLLEYANLIQGGHMGLDKFTWQIGTSYLWNTMLYLLIEVRARKTGPDVDKAWQLIGVVFERCPQVLEEFTGSVYVALGKWTLEVWNSHVAASKEEGLPEPVTPEYISNIREWQQLKEAEARARRDKAEARLARPGTRNSSVDDKFSYADYLEEGGSDAQYFPNLLSFETDPNQWMQWEQMVAEQAGF
ncbi:Transcription factor vrtR1 [Trichoderma ghanense]|uniref:Transcription factor vrtR1 n=1 Tax=Trichoderma ghanense TaxID=65468 RepID=A0ABY2GQ51_9HYPO